ncbi:MAG: hypothetical protein RL367_1739 [Pseudomonadota bacterium]
MWRYLAGGAGTLLIIAASWMLGQSMAKPKAAPLAVADGTALSPAPLAELPPPPPQASELSREQKRFNRYDKDRNGMIGGDEYFIARRKAYAKLDVNGDGVLSFDEYSIKARTKFAGADHDKSGSLNQTEFATTRVIRKAKPGCPPVKTLAPQPAEAPVEEDG